jgi:MarR family transcriptional regulator for hemolysin
VSTDEDACKLKEDIGLSLARIARGWRSRMDTRLSCMGMTQAKWVTLYHLSSLGEPVMQCDLASAIGIEGPTLVRLLDGLEKMDLIERCTAAHDRRGKLICLTSKASPLLDEIERISRDLKCEIFRDIPTADLEAVFAILNRLQDNLDAQSSSTCG